MIKQTQTYLNEEIAETIQHMRVSVVDATSIIGTVAPSLKTTAERYQTEMLDTVSRFESGIESELKNGQELLSVESLYKSVAPNDDISDALRAYRIISEYGIHLSEALKHYDDEGIREIEMTLFQPIIYEFDYVGSLSDNFRDVVTALKVALFSHNPHTYTREQIVALIKATEKLKTTVDVSDKTMNDIMDLLDEHFNLAGPFAGVNLFEQ